MTSHAAVVARGMGKPCVAGLRGAARSTSTARTRRRSAATRSREGDMITIDGGTGRVILGAVDARAAADQRGLRDDPRLGRRPAPPEGARERRHARGRRPRARVRRAGDRPLPHRAHVHGAGAAAGRPGDDPRLRRGRAPRGARAAAADAAVRLRGDLRGDGGAAGDDPAARPAAARVPARPRGGDRRAHARRGSRRCTRRTRCSARAAAGSACSGRRSTRCRCARSCGPPPRCATAPARRRSSRSCTRSSASPRSSPGCAS